MSWWRPLLITAVVSGIGAACASSDATEETDTADAGRPAGEGLDGGADNVPPPTTPRPRYRTRTGFDDEFAKTPACNPADLRVFLEEVCGLCTNKDHTNRVFCLYPNARSRTITPHRIMDLPDYEEDVVDPQNSLLSSAKAPLVLSALTPLPVGDGLISSEVGFFNGFEASAFTFFWDQFPTGLPPNHPGGGAVLGGKLFLPTANWDFERTAQAGGNPVYGDSSVVVYDLTAGGQLRVETARRLDLTIAQHGINPTAAAVLDDHTVVVLANNAKLSTDNAHKKAALIFIDAVQEKMMRTLDLGDDFLGAASGSLALSGDKKTAILGTQDNTGRVLFVDLETAAVTTLQVPRRPGQARSFPSAIEVIGETAYAYDFNSGWLTPIDVPTHTLQAALEVFDTDPTQTDGVGGKMTRWGDSLLLARRSRIVQFFPKDL